MEKRTAAAKLLVGAHTSIVGGVHQALLEGWKIGATTVQLFTSNQRRWEGKPLAQDAIDSWHQTMQETGLQQIMSHASYLINLAAPDLENLHKSRFALKEEVERCLLLGISYLNIHPGAALKDDPQVCLDRICESLLSVEHLVKGTSLRILLETTAGQGSTLGARFEELAYVIHKVEKRIPVGVCIDTCHIFVSGYDIRTPQKWRETLDDFNRTIGLKHLYAFHMNDSLKDLGSRVDRHQPLGEGTIGLECFKFLMTDPVMREIPKYLETPGGPSLWEKEIVMLRSYSVIS